MNFGENSSSTIVRIVIVREGIIVATASMITFDKDMFSFQPERDLTDKIKL